jgi:transposase
VRRLWAPGAQYDRLGPRRFEFVPLCSLRVFFLYMMRRVDCPRCGVTVEQVPWADDGKHQLTRGHSSGNFPDGR